MTPAPGDAAGSLTGPRESPGPAEAPADGRGDERPTPAQLYDCCLGGQDNSPIVREVVERLRAAVPELTLAAWANRGFHQRAAVWMARHGIRQYLDIGCGLPTTASTLDAVHKVCADARVAYIDCDPLVIQKAQSLPTKPGNATVLLADLRDPAALLTAVHLDGLINLAEPAGLLCTGVLDHLADDSDPHECLARLVAALAPGSYLALSHLTADQRPAPAVAVITGTCAGSQYLYPRSRAEVARFFEQLDVLPPYEGAEPGLCHIGLWGAEDPGTADDASSQWWWAGIAHLPTSTSCAASSRRGEPAEHAV